MTKPPDRAKFAMRTILLRGEEQRGLAIAMLSNVPLDAERPLELVVREEVKTRNLDQNAYYWKRLTEISDQAWFEGRQYIKDVWHEYARQNIMPEMVTVKGGEVRSKWLESPDGKPVVISTTQLERKCFADYTTAVEAFGASLGVHFSENRDAE